jgi:RHS repeat-associated protein
MTYTNYLANGIPDQLLYGNGISLNEKSLLNGDITEISFTNNSNNELLSLVYKWNENLEIDTVQRAGGISELLSYNYDFTGRLLGANGTEAAYSFGYDHLGNLIQQDSIDINYATFQPISVTNEQQDTLETYQYDLQGNLIEKRDFSNGVINVWKYEYDLWNKLVSVLENGDTIQTYTYDYKGNLLKEKRFSDQVEILYPFDGYTITNQVGTSTTEIDLTDGARIIAVATSTNVSDETITYYHQNNVGSTVLTTNEAGQVVDEISYQPYGAISQWITTTDSSTNYLYGSKTYSSATDLYNFSARSYNPRVARFTTSDNQVGGNPWKIDSYNQYCYTLNNPIKNSDPSGHGLEEDVLFIGGTFLLSAEALADLFTDGLATPALLLIDDAAFGAVEGTEGALDILDVVDVSEEGTTMEETSEETLSSTGGDDAMEDDNQRTSNDGDSMSDDESSSDYDDDPDDEDWKPKSEQASNRSKYMGGTPGKTSPTGRNVIERMKGEGKIKKIGGEWRFLASDRKWYLLEDADMSHIESAVSYWNRKGRFTGAKSVEVRMFMNDAGNYYLEYYRINRSEGGAMTARYLPPVKR